MVKFDIRKQENLNLRMLPKQHCEKLILINRVYGLSNLDHRQFWNHSHYKMECDLLDNETGYPINQVMGQRKPPWPQVSSLGSIVRTYQLQV